MSIVFYSFSDNFTGKIFLSLYIQKTLLFLFPVPGYGSNPGRQAAIVLIGYRLNCLRLTIFVPKFSTINISFNIYMILNLYKSYIIASLFVRSTAVPAVTAGQSDGDLDDCGYRKIPVKVEVFILPRKIVLSYTNDFYPSKWELPVKTGKKRERN